MNIRKELKSREIRSEDGKKIIGYKGQISFEKISGQHRDPEKREMKERRKQEKKEKINKNEQLKK